MTMEDTHIWTMRPDGSDRREVATLDNRQGAPHWSADGQALYFTVQDHGSVHLYRQPLGGGSAERILGDVGTIGSWSLGRTGELAFAMATPSRPSDLYFRANSGTVKKVTSLNDSLLTVRRLAEVDSFTARSVKGLSVQSFITRPLELTDGK